MKYLDYFAFNQIIGQKFPPHIEEDKVSADAFGKMAVELLAMVQAVGLAGEPFEAVAVHGVLERPFRHTDKDTVHVRLFRGRGEVVKALVGIDKNLLFFVEHPFNGQFGADAFLL